MSSAPSAKLVASSVGWSSVQIIVEQASLFLIFVVLARLLDPATFGIVALAVILSEFGKVIASYGLSAAVIQAPDLDESAANTTFWVNFAVAIVLGLVMIACATPLAALTKQSQLADALVALAIVPAITSLGAIHAARNIRGFGYRALALRTLAANLVAGAIAIALAASGHGIWALVVQRLVSETILTIASWIIYPWLPKAELALRRHRSLLVVGWHSTLTNLVFQLGSRVNELVLTFTLNYTAVGLIRIAFRLMDLITQFAVRPFSSVALPTFARVAAEPERLARQYSQIQMACALVAAPAITGLGLVADPLIPLVFGPQWVGVVPIAQILAFMAVPICMNYFATPVLTAVGRADVGFRIAIVQLGMGVAFCIAAAPFGLEWVAAAYVLRAYLTLPWVAYNLSVHAGVWPRRAFASVLPSAFSSSIMAAVVIGMDHYFLNQLPPVLRIAAKVAVAVPVYASAALATGGAELRQHVGRLLKLVPLR